MLFAPDNQKFIKWFELKWKQKVWLFVAMDILDLLFILARIGLMVPHGWFVVSWDIDCAILTISKTKIGILLGEIIYLNINQYYKKWKIIVLWHLEKEGITNMKKRFIKH